MSGKFYDRLKKYYMNVGEVLRGEADLASIFPNPTDIGTSREGVYAEFLQSHLPSCCNVLYGGFLFNLEGEESKQLDLIVTTDSCPSYNFLSKDHYGKSFACIEGAIAIVSIKSNLTSNELTSALDNIASLPNKKPLDERVPFTLKIPNYEDWPFKIIYAPRGVSLKTLLSSITEFYQENPAIPVIKRPNLIHVAGKYNVVRTGPKGGKTRDGTEITPNVFYPHMDKTDVYALAYAVNEIQKRALGSKHILFTYNEILDSIPF